MSDDLFEFTAVRRVFAVMGHPVSHSLSPRIHRMFARQTGIELSYDAIQVDPGGFPIAVRNFHAHGGSGLNVTLPFKEEAFRLADSHTPRARRAGAANTLVLGEEIVADNTDGAGLVRDLVDNLGCPLTGRRLLLVGAGGAVRGVLAPLLDCAPASITIVNRTPGRAAALARDFGDLGALAATTFAALADQRFDVVINGTSASVSGERPPLPASCMTECQLAYDMMYADAPTPFLAFAREAGADQAHDGIGMLVEQAAESFTLWHGRRPDTDPVRSALRPPRT